MPGQALRFPNRTRVAMNTALASGLQGHLSTAQHALPRRARAQVAVRCSSSCDGDQPQQQSSRRGMLQLAAAAAVLPFLGGAGPAAAAEAEGLNPFRGALEACGVRRHFYTLGLPF